MRLQVASAVRSAALRNRCLSLAKTLFDRVEIRAVGWKEQQVGTGLPDRPPDGASLVAGEIVHHHHVLRCQRRHKEALDINAKRISVHRSIQDEGGINPADAQCGDEGHGEPMAVGGISGQAFAPRCPAAQRCHVGLGQVSSMKTSRFGSIRF